MEKPTATGPSPGGAGLAPGRPRADEGAAKAGPCPVCGLPPGAGRYGWGGGAPDAYAERCLACERVIDHFPAGCIELSGKRFVERRGEIMKEVVRCGQSESARHPREHVDRVETVAGSVAVWTSHARLAQRIGDLVQERFGGRLAYRFERAAEVLHVVWQSEP